MMMLMLSIYKIIFKVVVYAMGNVLYPLRATDTLRNFGADHYVYMAL